MKNKEEIEKLATKNYRSNGSGGGQYTEGLQDGRKIGFVDGYTKCQEDMQKDVEYWQSESDHWHQQAMEMSKYKYTEEDLRNTINETINACNTAQKESYGELEIDADKIINSLNKQY
jgi:hypothetical protein